MRVEEIVQLYISKPVSSVERADKELKAFKKVNIAAGETATVTLNVPVKDPGLLQCKNKKLGGRNRANISYWPATSSRAIEQSSVITVN